MNANKWWKKNHPIASILEQKCWMGCGKKHHHTPCGSYTFSKKTPKNIKKNHIKRKIAVVPPSNNVPTSSIIKSGRILISHLSDFVPCSLFEIYSSCSCSFLLFVTHQPSAHHPFYPCNIKFTNITIPGMRKTRPYLAKMRGKNYKIVHSICQANNFHSISMCLPLILNLNFFPL